MAIYFLLGTLTPQGQNDLSMNSNRILQVSNNIKINDTTVLGQYATLGHYDYVTMVEAESNDAVAKLSAELGARTGLRFETLSAIRHVTPTGDTDPNPKQMAESLERQTPARKPVS